MSDVIGAEISVRQAVSLLSGVRRRHVWRLVLVRSLWVGLAAAMLCFYLDAVLQLGGTMRLMLNAAAAGAVVATAVLSWWRLNRTTARDKMLARLVECEHPELGNDLTNAIDFEGRLKGGHREAVSLTLMQKGIERGAQSFEQVEGLESLKPPTLRRESFVLVGVLAAWVICAIIFYPWMFAEVPRFLSPFADHPPYSPTRLVVAPAGAVVDYGKNITINVTARGKMPKDVSLVVVNPAEGQTTSIPMFKSEDGKYFQTIEDIRSGLVYWAAIERGRSKYYRIDLCKSPRIESVQVRYRYPTYSRLPERHTSLSPEDSTLKGYKGTQVTMTVASNRPLGGGTVSLGGQTYACAGQPDNTVTGEFPLTGQSDFSLSVTDTEGNVSTEPFKGKVSIVPDNKPMISIVSPAVQSLAIPTAKIPVVIEAQDDLGIGDVSLFRSHNESEDARKHLLKDTAGTFVSVAEMLDLADLGVRPGDVIDFYATATDSLPDSPQTVASEPYRLEIISEEEYAQMMRNQMTAEDLRIKYDNIISQMNQLVAAQEQLAKETQALKDGLDKAGDAPPSQDDQKKLADLEQRQNELAEKTQELAKKLEEESKSPPVVDIEKDYKQFLADFSQNMTTAESHMTNSAGEMNQGGKAGAQCPAHLAVAMDEQKKALEQLGAQTQEMKDKIQQANREIEKVIKLMADVETFKALYTGQKNVTRQTKTYSEVEAEDLDTRTRLAELGDREGAIQKQLDTLKGQFREHGKEIEEEYPKVADDAARIADEIEQRKIADLMQTGAGFLNRGSGVQGYPNVLEALKQMAAMISFCENAGGKGCKNCEFRLKIQMSLNPGDTMSQLSQSLGMGMGMGVTGALGRGASGFAGGQSNINVFGGETWGQDMQMNSSLTAGEKKVEAQAISLPNQRDPLSGNIEELTPQSKREVDSDVKGDARMMAEYRQLIEAYFRRLAEER